MSQPGVAVVVAVAGVAVAVVIALLHRGAERGATCREALIPAYLPPHELTALVGAARRPRMVIVNPDSGPGARRSPAYAAAVHALQAAGVRVLGYVPTGYGWRPLHAGLADVDRFVSWYGVDGIFFDEAASDEAQLAHYRALARAARGDPGRLVVLNPGVPPAPGYFDLADVVVTFEGTAAAYADALRATPGWLRREDRDRVAHLVYGASRADALDALSGSAAGYVYATSGALPNPWRTLPDYLDEEVEALATCG
ncbi:spherulation-specific family 4 protein [Baekduia alba]|uniref:spherulation-specific family 4 protein n=1 Tax=Baekduia alba TaxID=2997333 RepID=UPI0023403007|nr:spherulation-specific family 4 protein [Baekduia alba]